MMTEGQLEQSQGDVQDGVAIQNEANETQSESGFPSVEDATADVVYTDEPSNVTDVDDDGGEEDELEDEDDDELFDDEPSILDEDEDLDLLEDDADLDDVPAQEQESNF